MLKLPKHIFSCRSRAQAFFFNETAGKAGRSGASREPRLWSWALALVLLATLLFFVRLGDRGLWGPEGRWGSVAREMQLSGNYFWPTVNGEVYFDKPLLSYWFVVAASHFTGAMNETATRLPSAVFGLLGVVLLLVLVQRLYDRRSAILAGFVLATSYSYVFYARLASADMETVTGVLAAVTLFLFCEERKSYWWVVGLWLIMAVTSLTKGLLGFALPLIVIGCYSLLSEGWREFFNGILRGPLANRVAWLIARERWLLNSKTLLAVMLAGIVYYLPFGISRSNMHSDVGLYLVFRENIVRFFWPFDHRDPVYLYTYWIFIHMVPWSAFLPAVLMHMFSGPKNKSDRFALTYFWATFIFFTLSGSRRNYYLIPILPAAAILTARLFSVPKDALNRRVRELMGAGFVILTISVVAFGILALLPAAMRPGRLSHLPELPDRLLFAAIWVVQIAAGIFALLRSSPAIMRCSVCVMAYLSLLHMFASVMPSVETFRAQKTFAHAVRSQLKGDMSRLALFKVGGAGLVFDLSAKEPIPQYLDIPSLVHWLENKPDSWVILQEQDLRSLSLRGSVVEREASYSKAIEDERGLILFRARTGAKENLAKRLGSRSP